MNVSRFVPILVTALALFGALAPQAARSVDGPPPPDVLYIGDGGDNTIKSFAADTGAFLGVSDGPLKSGLAGPRGIVVDGGGFLLVVNQNVNLDIPGDVLKYDKNTLKFGGALTLATDNKVNNTPVAPDGLVLCRQSVPWGCAAAPGNADLFVAIVLRNANTGPPGRVARYNSIGMFLGAATIKNNEHHPRGVVFGPDGLLYVSTRDLTNGLGGTVLRFSADGKSEVFIDDKGGPGHLNRPDGLVFGPDGCLYVTSFKDLTVPGDTDSILIYDAQGARVAKIDLLNTDGSRAFAQSLLFGPTPATRTARSLFVPINNTGEVRRYDPLPGPGTGCKAYNNPFILVAGGGALRPQYMTFGNTDPSTLEYIEPAP